MYRKGGGMAIPGLLPGGAGHAKVGIMRKRLVVGFGALLVLASTGAVAFWKLRPTEPPPAPTAERGYDDIKRDEYERWMQDLGYTE